MRSRRWFPTVFAVFGMVAVLAAPPGAQRTNAQIATPVATLVGAPIPGSVPCTTLFGIALDTAWALILHGATQVAPVDVYVDGQLAVHEATFGTLNDFIPVAAGNRQIQFVPSGGAIDTTIRLADGVGYEVAALGSVEDIGLQTHSVDTRPLPENGSRLRVIHAAPDVPAIDIAVTGGVPVIDPLETGDSSASVDLPSGTYELEVRAAGTNDVALPLPGTSLALNTVYSVYVTGLIEEGSLGTTLIPMLVPPGIAAGAGRLVLDQEPGWGAANFGNFWGIGGRG